MILILLGAAGSALIALRSGDREYFVAVRRDIPQGTKLTEKDLARASFAGDTKALVSWSDLDKVKDRYTTTALYTNQPITIKNVTEGTAPEVPPNGALVGISLEDGRLPSDGLSGGDIVKVIRVPANNSDGQPSVLVDAAVVTTTGRKIGDEKASASAKTQTATILVPSTDAAAVGAAAATKTIVLVRLPPNTKPEISPAGGSR